MRYELMVDARRASGLAAVERTLDSGEVPMDRGVQRAVLATMRDLATDGSHGAGRFPLTDLTVAAAAQDAGIDILHFDRHLERLANVSALGRTGSQSLRKVVEPAGRLSNPLFISNVRRLLGEAKRQKTSDVPPQQRPSKFKPPQKGLIRGAIADALAGNEEGLRMRDIAIVVADRLGEPIPCSSIKSCLAREAAKTSVTFERIERGRYRLRPETGSAGQEG